MIVDNLRYFSVSFIGLGEIPCEGCRYKIACHPFFFQYIYINHLNVSDALYRCDKALLAASGFRADSLILFKKACKSLKSSLPRKALHLENIFRHANAKRQLSVTNLPTRIVRGVSPTTDSTCHSFAATFSNIEISFIVYSMDFFAPAHRLRRRSRSTVLSYSSVQCLNPLIYYE